MKGNSSRSWTSAQVRALGLHTDVATAAAVLGVGRSTAYELIRRDQFPVPVIRIGSRFRVPVAPLLDLLYAERVEPHMTSVPTTSKEGA